MPKMLILLADAELYDPPKEQTVLEFIETSKKYHATVRYEVLPHRTHMGTVEQMINQSDPTVQRIVKFIAHETINTTLPIQ